MEQQSNLKYHNPVLFAESLDALITNSNGSYVDATFGGGGHSKGILERLSESGKLFAFDQDPDAALNQLNDGRFCFIPNNFSTLKAALFLNGAKKVSGILADLGVSSHQFDIPERGFSFRFNEARLDMRMDKGSPITAVKVIHTYTEEKLADVFYYYGELKESRKIASIIIRNREDKKIETVGDLKEVLKPITPFKKESQFLAKVFQALRIEVNQEMEVLKSFLNQSVAMLEEGGRLVVISYHSLEDRLVKNFIRSGNFEGEIEKDFFGNSLRPYKPLYSKPIVPTNQEIEENPRARSAKMRIAVKVAEGEKQ